MINIMYQLLSSDTCMRLELLQQQLQELCDRQKAQPERLWLGGQAGTGDH